MFEYIDWLLKSGKNHYNEYKNKLLFLNREGEGWDAYKNFWLRLA